MASASYPSGVREDAGEPRRVADQDVSDAESATTNTTANTARDFDARQPVKVQVKNTFYHVDDRDSTLERERVGESCPPVLGESEFKTKDQRDREKLEAHQRGDCQPCAYFAYREDGCRQGDDCSYCHLCDRIDIKRKKKDRARCLKSAAKQAAAIDEDEVLVMNDRVHPHSDVVAASAAAAAYHVAMEAAAAAAMHAAGLAHAVYMPYGCGAFPGMHGGLPMHPPPAMPMHAPPAEPPVLPAARMPPALGNLSLRGYFEGLGLKDVELVAGVYEENGIDNSSELLDLDEQMRLEVDGELKKAGACIGDRNKCKKAK